MNNVPFNMRVARFAQSLFKFTSLKDRVKEIQYNLSLWFNEWPSFNCIEFVVYKHEKYTLYTIPEYLDPQEPVYWVFLGYQHSTFFNNYKNQSTAGYCVLNLKSVTEDAFRKSWRDPLTELIDNHQPLNHGLIQSILVVMKRDLSEARGPSFKGLPDEIFIL